jgi:hypothetical protein
VQSLTLPDAWAASTHLLADRLLVLDWNRDLPWQDVAPEELANMKHLLPAVLELTALTDAQRQAVQGYLGDNAPPSGPAAMLLTSDLSTEVLARRLAQRVIITLADDSRALLRFADPRAFVHLLWVLPVGHFTALYDGINQWFFPFQGQWHELEFRKRPEGQWGPLDARSSMELLNIGLINDALLEMPLSRDLADHCVRGQEIYGWLNRAQNEFALTDAEDCVAFSRHGMRYGKGFTRHKTLAEWLHASRETPGVYARQTAPLSAEDWKNILANVRWHEQHGGA